MKSREIIEYITDWLRNYLEEAKAKGFVMGVSGGIDSAVTSTLAARTGLPLLCVEMPIHQGRIQISRAQDHIAFLKENYPNTRTHEVELTPVFDAVDKGTAGIRGYRKKEISLVNVRARLRMTTLYYFSGLYDYLVVGTGNKVEDFGIGFFTKYGDGGVDLSPIGDLTKSRGLQAGRRTGHHRIHHEGPADRRTLGSTTVPTKIRSARATLNWSGRWNFTETNRSSAKDNVKYSKSIEDLPNTNLHKMEPVPVCKIPRT